MLMQHAIIQKDLTLVHVILDSVVMDYRVMVGDIICLVFCYFTNDRLGKIVNKRNLRVCFSFTILLEINECSPVSPCHVNATCNNTEGSYACTCDSGYSGDGFSCGGT
jgi:hypothetical protein